MNYNCPVCGYQEITPFDEHGYSTHEICDCCGNQAGYQYDSKSSKERMKELTKSWVIEKNMSWHSTVAEPPKDWCPTTQLKLANITV